MSYLGGIESYKNISCEQRFPLYLFFTEKVSAPYSIEQTDIDKEVETPGMEIIEFTSFITQNESKENYTFKIVEDSIGLISYNSCTGENAFKRFLKKTFKVLKKENVSKLIIDIRENGGGNSSLNDRLLSYITKKAYRQSSGRYWKVSKEAKLTYKKNGYEKMFGKEFMKEYVESENGSIIESLEEGLTQPESPKNYFEGKTCFLVGAKTFSSANFLADAVKIYELSTLIGLATGEYTNDFGEQLDFTLPNSGHYIYVSSTYDIGANGNSNLFEPVYPDIEVKEDILKFAIDWIKKEAKDSSE
jgi:C-terminal processing protease CtpA/Prc